MDGVDRLPLHIKQSLALLLPLVKYAEVLLLQLCIHIVRARVVVNYGVG